jgi:hypothetical protein
MIKEEILYQTSKTGTTVFYFVPNVTPEMVPLLEEPAYLVLNNLNVPVSFYNYASGTTEVWKLENVNGYNTNVLISQMPPISVIVSGTTGTTYVTQPNPNTINYITGYSTSQTFKKTLSIAERDVIQQRFNNSVTTTITAQTQVAVNYPTYVFFNEHEVDDMFANIKLSRTYETLDTLQIYNKPINTIPTQEALTGVLFGKLQAIQILKDEVGNNIKIPLRNVPVGIFNKSEEFPSPMSLDDNGDRFFMNLKENSNTSQYIDTTAFGEDEKFLKSQSASLTIPEKFKYTTITNDNGEFVIYNAPVGNNVVVFEVDLFKQGLTKDEIILSNFPFPTNDDANIGELPCYYYNQVPVDVVPAWGTTQTGYTELNINVNLDLRKWATYIFAPATFGGAKLETTVAQNVANTFKIQIRDMTNKKFAPKTLEVVQVPNDLDRRPGAQFLWFNEILDQRQQVEFFKFGCHVLKLPANLYDPNAYKTDNDGNPTNQRGLWLAAYQFRTFVNKSRTYRDTGGHRAANGIDFWSHFNVNHVPSPTNLDDADFSGLGRFPYERPWSITYPEPYKVPKKPTGLRYNYAGQRTFFAPYVVQEPAYTDGDLVGNVLDNTDPDSVGGFSLQYFNSTWFPNQISHVATRNYMYKYEKDVSSLESYANAFEPAWTPTNLGPYTSYPSIVGMSSVVNGEKYQRVECGHGYFMKYQDWVKVYRAVWSTDTYTDFVYPGFTSLNSLSNRVYNIDDQNYAFAFDRFGPNFTTNKGGIDIYRIVESGLDNILPLENFLIPTGTHLWFGQTTTAAYWSLTFTNTGIIDGKITHNLNGGYAAQVVNPSGGTLLFYAGQEFVLNVGGYFVVNNNASSSSAQAAFKYTQMKFSGNDSFDSNTNKFTRSNYKLDITLQTNFAGGDGNIYDTPYITNEQHYLNPDGFPATTDYVDLYINSSYTDNVGDASGIRSSGHLYQIYIEGAPR